MKKLSVLIAAAAIALASCTPLTVNVDYDHSKDFSAMKTFALYQHANRSVSELNQERLVAAVRDQLKAKGYAEVAENPDFLININTIVKDKKSVSANTDIYGYGGFYRPYGYWGGGMGMASANTTFNVEDYKDGSVIVDMVDAKTNQLFWEGVGNSEIDSPLSDPDKQIAAAVAKILATYPAAGTPIGAKK